MEFDPSLALQKIRGLSHNMPMIGLALPAIIRDSETGQVNWSNIITGGLTACVIAAGTYGMCTKIGGVVGTVVEWTYDGLSLVTAAPNAYGPVIVMPGPQFVEVETIRYSNRVYGLRVTIPGEYQYHFRPPMSPEGQSIYVADIVSGAKPFATYHPITQALTWETGFVNYV